MVGSVFVNLELEQFNLDVQIQSLEPGELDGGALSCCADVCNCFFRVWMAQVKLVFWWLKVGPLSLSHKLGAFCGRRSTLKIALVFGAL